MAEVMKVADLMELGEENKVGLDLFISWCSLAGVRNSFCCLLI